jgi:prepilin-type N-terminal cleavage/methylation domain-containing protein
VRSDAAKLFGTRPRRIRPGFSLLELVIVVVVIGVMAAIAMPRFSSAAERAHAATLAESTSRFQRALERYAAERNGLTPNHDSVNVTCNEVACFVARLTGRSNDANQPDDAGIWGPYLGEIPVNPFNGLRTVRLDGAAAGAGTHGWRFDTRQNVIQPDHRTGPAVVGGAPTPVEGGNQVVIVDPRGGEGSQSIPAEGVPLD